MVHSEGTIASNPFSTNGVSDLNQLVYTTKAKGFLDWARRWSRQGYLWPFPVGTTCCGMEYWAAYTSQFDLEKLGSPPDRRLPEKSDLMVLVGTVTKNLLPYILEAYERMGPRKWVMAVGACAASGGPYATYNVIPGIHQYIPVDAYVPGCPPSPEAILQAVRIIQERIKHGVCAVEGVKMVEEGAQP